MRYNIKGSNGDPVLAPAAMSRVSQTFRPGDEQEELTRLLLIMNNNQKAIIARMQELLSKENDVVKKLITSRLPVDMQFTTNLESCIQHIKLIFAIKYSEDDNPREYMLREPLKSRLVNMNNSAKDFLKKTPKDLETLHLTDPLLLQELCFHLQNNVIDFKTAYENARINGHTTSSGKHGVASYCQSGGATR